MRAGIAFALLSAVLVGASTALAKLILGPYLGAGLGLAGVSLGRRHPHDPDLHHRHSHTHPPEDSA